MKDNDQHCEDIRILSFEEATELHESMEMAKEKLSPEEVPWFGGMVNIYDKDTGEILVSKRPNIVTLRGRLFALERLYNHGATQGNTSALDGNNPFQNGSYRSNLDREIVFFTVGSGGANAGDWFNTKAPTFNSTALYNQIAFRRVPEAIYGTSTGNDLTPAEREFYFLPRKIGNEIHFFGKRFNEQLSNFLIDTTNNKVYKKLTLEISNKDCRIIGNDEDRINELGLIIASKNKGGITVPYTQNGGRLPIPSSANQTNLDLDWELYSHLTFKTEAIYGTKSLLIEYYTYA
jgi:hypothetical protein